MGSQEFKTDKTISLTAQMRNELMHVLRHGTSAVVDIPADQCYAGADDIVKKMKLGKRFLHEHPVILTRVKGERIRYVFVHPLLHLLRSAAEDTCQGNIYHAVVMLNRGEQLQTSSPLNWYDQPFQQCVGYESFLSWLEVFNTVRNTTSRWE